MRMRLGEWGGRRWRGVRRKENEGWRVRRVRRESTERRSMGDSRG